MRKILLVIVMGFIAHQLLAQDADDLLNEMTSQQSEVTTATFKASRVILGHSVEQPKKGEMEFRISHRFGQLNGGAYDLWGLDQAWIHFSLEYSPVERFTIGVGRSNYKKTFDGFLKYALFQQQSGANTFPLSISLVGTAEYFTLKNDIPDFNNNHRLSYTAQALLARKFNKNLSIQLSPTYVHKNYVESNTMKNDVLALGFGGRYKVSKRLSINAEFFWVSDLNGPNGTMNEYPLSVGIDLETGGHVFQIMLTNSLPMREVGFLTETRGKWSDGAIHLGFNISRMFNLHD